MPLTDEQITAATNFCKALNHAKLYFNDINQLMGFMSYQQLKNIVRDRRDWFLQGLTVRKL